MEKFLGIFPRIGRNFSMNMSENFLGIFSKLIPRNIHSKTQIFLRKNSELYLYGYFKEKKLQTRYYYGSVEQKYNRTYANR
jgi:hypothetical protein